MILVDTSVIVAYQDATHEQHEQSAAALERWEAAGLAVSVVTIAELAAGGRTAEALTEDFEGWKVLPIDAADALRAGQAFAQSYSSRRSAPLPDFFIRSQAAVRELKHLTFDRRRVKHFPDVDFEFD